MLRGQADDLVQALAHRREVRGDIVDAAEVGQRQRLRVPARDEVDRWTAEGAGEAASVFEVGAPVEQMWQGLRRYWAKHGAAAAR